MCTARQNVYMCNPKPKQSVFAFFPMPIQMSMVPLLRLCLGLWLSFSSFVLVRGQNCFSIKWEGADCTKQGKLSCGGSNKSFELPELSGSPDDQTLYILGDQNKECCDKYGVTRPGPSCVAEKNQRFENKAILNLFFARNDAF